MIAALTFAARSMIDRWRSITPRAIAPAIRNSTAIGCAGDTP